MIIAVGDDVSCLSSRLQLSVLSQDRLIPGARIAAEGFPMSIGLSEKVGRDFSLAQLN